MAMHYRRHPPANNSVNPFTGRGLPTASPYRPASDNDGHGKSHSSISMMAKKATLIILSFFMFFYILRSSGEDVAVVNNPKHAPVKLKMPDVSPSDARARDGGSDYDPKWREDIKQEGEKTYEYNYKEEDKNEFFDRDGSPDAKDSTDGNDNNQDDYEDGGGVADPYGNGENESRDLDGDYKRPTVSSVDRDAFSGVDNKLHTGDVGGDSQDFSVEKSDIEEHAVGDKSFQYGVHEKNAGSNDGNDGPQDAEDSEFDRKTSQYVESESGVKQVDAHTPNAHVGRSDLVYKNTDDDESREKQHDNGRRQEDGEVSLRLTDEGESKYAKRTDQEVSNEEPNEHAEKPYQGEESLRSAKLKYDKSGTLSEDSKKPNDNEVASSSANNESESLHDKPYDSERTANKYDDPNSKYHDKDRADEKVKEYSRYTHENSNGGGDFVSEKDNPRLGGLLGESELSTDVIETKTLEVPISHSEYKSENKTKDYYKQKGGDFESDRSVDENEDFKRTYSNIEKSRGNGEVVSDRDEPELVEKTTEHDAYDSPEKTYEYSMQRPADAEEDRALGNSEDGLKWKNLDSKYRASNKDIDEGSGSFKSQTMKGLDKTEKKLREYTPDREQSDFRQSIGDNQNAKESSRFETSRDDREGSNDHQSKVVEEHSKNDANEKISEYSMQRREEANKDLYPGDSADILSDKTLDSKHLTQARDGQAATDHYTSDSLKDREPVSSKYDKSDAEEKTSKHSSQMHEDSTGAVLTESKNANSTDNENQSNVPADEHATKVGPDEKTSDYVANSNKYSSSGNQLKEESEGNENAARSTFSDVDWRTIPSTKNQTEHEKLSDGGSLSDVEEPRLISKKYPKGEDESSARANQTREDSDADQAVVAGKDIEGPPESESKSSKLRGGGAVTADSHDAAVAVQPDHIGGLSTRDRDEDEESTEVRSIKTHENASSGDISKKIAKDEANQKSNLSVNEDEAPRSAETEQNGSGSSVEGYVSSKSDKSVGNATKYETSGVQEAREVYESKNVNGDEKVENTRDRSNVHDNAKVTYIIDEEESNPESRLTGSVRGAISKKDQLLKSIGEEEFAKLSASSSGLRGSKENSIAREDVSTKDGSDEKASEYIANSDKYNSPSHQLEDGANEKEHISLSRSDEVDKDSVGSVKSETIDDKRTEGDESKIVDDTGLAAPKYPKDDEKSSEPLNRLTVVGDEDPLEADPKNSKPHEEGESATDAHREDVTEKSDRVDNLSTRDGDEDEESTKVKTQTHEDASLSEFPKKNAQVEADGKRSSPINKDEASIAPGGAETETNRSSSKTEDYVSSKSDKSVGSATSYETSQVDESKRKGDSGSVNNEWAPASVASDNKAALLDSTDLQAEKKVDLL
ncbi:hypothetical protein ACHAW6_005734 [Cyclotella cf. meneghiniana]